MQDNQTVEFQHSVFSQDEIYNEEKNIFYRAIKDAKEAHSLARELIHDNEERNDRNAKIAARLNDAQPFDPKKLKAAKQDWRSNFSSGFLSGIIKRAAPAYKQTVDGAKTLTMSTLPDTSAEGEEKSDIFKNSITKTIRRWSGWNDLLTQIIQENLAYGYAATVKTDEIDWRPTFARQDEIFFPDKCPQEAEKVPFFVYKQDYPLHDLAAHLQNQEASTAAGWNVENLIRVLNTSDEEHRGTGQSEDAREAEDLIRENTIGSTYVRKGSRLVEAYHVCVTETTGTVSHWIVSAKDGRELFVRLDRWESMDEVLSLFAIEVGNGHLHGSKGAGRLLHNRSLVIERSRNLALDNLFLSGLLPLRATSEGKHSANVTVTHPFMVIDEGYEVVSQQIEANVDAFYQLDQYNVKLAEEQVGSLMPTATQSIDTETTASAINLVASVEQQIREGILLRFWNQSLKMIFQMQRAICSTPNIERAMTIYQATAAPQTKTFTRKMWEFVQKMGSSITGQPVIIEENDAYDSEGVDCVLNMLQKGLRPEEIYELANCPPQQVVEDMAARNAQLIDQLVMRYVNDPSIDQQVLREEDVASKLGYTAAKRWVIDKEDPTRLVEATRQQIEEIAVMLEGMEVPVSPRDPDKIHLGVIMEKAQTLLPQVQNIPPQALAGLKAIVAHAEAHLQNAQAKGVPAESLEMEAQFVSQAQQLISRLGVADTEGGGLPQGVPSIQEEDSTGGSIRPEQVPLKPQPPVPSVEGSENLPRFPQGMSPAEAASNKPFSRTPFNLTPET